MAATKLFIVVKQDTVIQMREYLVRAHSADHARECVDSGMFICETEPETMDLIESQTTACEEVNMDIVDDVPGSAPKIVKGES